MRYNPESARTTLTRIDVNSTSDRRFNNILDQMAKMIEQGNYRFRKTFSSPLTDEDIDDLNKSGIDVYIEPTIENYTYVFKFVRKEW